MLGEYNGKRRFRAYPYSCDRGHGITAGNITMRACG